MHPKLGIMYMVIFLKLPPVALGAPGATYNSYHIDIFPKFPPVVRGIPGAPQNRYYMVILPKLPPVAEVPLVHPKIGIIWSFYQSYHHLPEVPLV